MPEPNNVVTSTTSTKSAQDLIAEARAGLIAVMKKPKKSLRATKKAQADGASEESERQRRLTFCQSGGVITSIRWTTRTRAFKILITFVCGCPKKADTSHGSQRIETPAGVIVLVDPHSDGWRVSVPWSDEYVEIASDDDADEGE